MLHRYRSFSSSSIYPCWALAYPSGIIDICFACHPTKSNEGREHWGLDLHIIVLIHIVDIEIPFGNQVDLAIGKLRLERPFQTLAVKE